MSTALNGRTALVTGAGRGIGRAIAVGLARAGGTVGLVARSPDELAETARQVQAAGGIPSVIIADLGDPAELAAIALRASSQIGTVEVLVNNAGVVAPLGATASVDPAEWALALAVNVTAVAGLTIALLPAMLDRGWGRVANVSSGVAASPTGMIRANAYVTGKAALEAHTLNLAAELAGSGVTVNVYRPGGVDTAMQAWIRGQEPARIGTGMHDRFTRSYETGSLITPEQSAASLLARLPGEATGQVWSVTDPL
jgi:NAD(P)-dependent dehydrogenase (short-subunit alcohol dehydrogenase family)